jgi:hypothetical protein
LKQISHTSENPNKSYVLTELREETLILVTLTDLREGTLILEVATSSPAEAGDIHKLTRAAAG